MAIRVKPGERVALYHDPAGNVVLAAGPVRVETVPSDDGYEIVVTRDCEILRPLGEALADELQTAMKSALERTTRGMLTV